MAAREHGDSARGLASRMAALYAAVFAIVGTQSPYLPLWLDWRGMSAGEIALITSLPFIARIAVTPAVAFAADRGDAHRTSLVLLAWTGLAAVATLTQFATFWAILVLVLVSSLAWTTMMPLAETIAMRGVARVGLDYGRMRVWGSLSFIAASWAGGLVIERAGPAAAVWLIAGGGLLTAIAAHGVPAIARPQSAGAAPPAPLRAGEITALLGTPAFLALLIASSATQAAHAVLYTFGSLHWLALGFDAGTVGALWALGVAVEVVLFAASGVAVARIGPVPLIVLGAAASVVRWLAMAFDPPLAVLVLLQALHALTFGATHLGAIHAVARLVPDRQAGTAQALQAAFAGGIAMATATLIAGEAYPSLAGRTYALMAALALIGLAAALVLRRMGRPVP